MVTKLVGSLKGMVDECKKSFQEFIKDLKYTDEVTSDNLSKLLRCTCCRWWLQKLPCVAAGDWSRPWPSAGFWTANDRPRPLGIGGGGVGLGSAHEISQSSVILSKARFSSSTVADPGLRRRNPNPHLRDPVSQFHRQTRLFSGGEELGGAAKIRVDFRALWRRFRSVSVSVSNHRHARCTTISFLKNKKGK